MCRVSAVVLTGCLVLVMAFATQAQVPDPNNSTIVLDPQSSILPGLMTCPAGDGDQFDFIRIQVLDSGGFPIPGIAASNFVLLAIGGDVSFFSSPSTPVTDNNGEILFSVVANEAIASPYAGGSPLQIFVEIMGVWLASAVNLSCNTVDYDLNGQVNPIDFVTFSSDFLTPNLRSDLDWSGGTVNPLDFSKFARHFGH